MLSYECLLNKNMKDIKSQKFFSTTEAARILGISRQAVFQKIRAGLIPAQKIGRNYIIAADSLTKSLDMSLTDDRKQEIDAAMKKVVKEYGETLRLLGKE